MTRNIFRCQSIRCFRLSSIRSTGSAHLGNRGMCFFFVIGAIFLVLAPEMREASAPTLANSRSPFLCRGDWFFISAAAEREASAAKRRSEGQPTLAASACCFFFVVGACFLGGDRESGRRAPGENSEGDGARYRGSLGSSHGKPALFFFAGLPDTVEMLRLGTRTRCGLKLRRA